MSQVWLLPLLVFSAAFVLAIPLGLTLAKVFDARLGVPKWLRSIEACLDTGPQNWKQYALSFMAFHAVTFLVGFVVLALQPYLPLNPDGKQMLGPTMIFHTVISFLTNTNQQHYSGEVHLSYFSQLFFICWKQVLSPMIGMAALLAVIRGLRGDSHMGNFYVDLWRGTAYIFVPLCLAMGVLFIASGVPMTLEGQAEARTLEPGAMGMGSDGQATLVQSIARGPVAAIVAAKQFGTNGGGFFGANSAHPFENPNAFSNLLSCVGLFLLPVAALVMFGKMLNRYRDAAVIFGVMLVLSVASVAWAICYDTLQPNAALTAHPARVYSIPAATTTGGQRDVTISAVAALPVDQTLGNLEGKELRFGTAAGATWAALTTNTSNGSVNAMHDSLNPLAGIAPLAGMWLNCIWGGVGVGLINLLVYLIIGVFLAGLMVGRTPEYLGKKVEAREMKLASLAMLVHPLLVLIPTGLFAATNWGLKAESNPAAHGFSQVLYEFSSASANNGSGCEGLGDTWGFNKPEDNPSAPAPYSRPWDIVCGLVMLVGRFVPIIAPLAVAASLAAKKPTPITVGTLRTNTVTFGCVLLGTILLVGALLFLPVAALGPVAEHFGPLPFGG
ncbi:MAG: potassium-transporting ATPase subunit KdpA [Planctomycetota bacterium]|nr:potassium-transporting ATPase subunit KdpA [Planctomycetota bacterium]